MGSVPTRPFTEAPTGQSDIARCRRVPLLVIASAIACVITLGFWVRSYLPEHLHVSTSDGKLLLLFANDGLTNFWRVSHYGNEDSAKGQPVPTVDLWKRLQGGRFITPAQYVSPGPRIATNAPPTATGALGVVVFTETSGAGRVPYTFVVIPLLYVALAFAVGRSRGSCTGCARATGAGSATAPAAVMTCAVALAARARGRRTGASPRITSSYSLSCWRRHSPGHGRSCARAWPDDASPRDVARRATTTSAARRASAAPNAARHVHDLTRNNPRRRNFRPARPIETIRPFPIIAWPRRGARLRPPRG